MSYFVPFDVVLSYGISEQYLKFAIHKYRESIKSWQNKKDETDARKVLIDLDSIPPRTRQKYNIPTGSEYFELELDREEREREEIRRKNIERKENKDYADLENAYKSDWHKYYHRYLEIFKGKPASEQRKLAKLYAQNIAYWRKMVDITGGKYKRHGTLTPAFQNHLKLRKELDFTSNFEEYNRFSVYLGNIREAIRWGRGIEESIVHKSTNKEKPKKTSDFHTMVALEILSHPKNYSYPKVTDLLNHICKQNGYETVSESWVKAQMSNANAEFRNLVNATRKGEKHFKTNLHQYAIREQTTLPGDVWMIDGSPIQFYCWSKNGKKFTRLNLYVIVDVGSRKVVGFDIAYNEDKYNIMNALQMAVEMEGHLPSEIVSDNFSANKSAELLHIKTLFEEMGCAWRHHKVGNPQDKVYVERFYGAFQSVFCALYDDYLGKGIGARDTSGNPSPEFLKEALKKEGFLNEDQMRQRIAFLIGLHNTTERKGITAPNEAYKLIKPNVVEVDFAKTALIFWKVTKNTIKNSMIKIKVRNKEYQFDIHGTDNRLKLNGTTVRVRYDETALDSVAVFDYHSDLFICECKAIVKLVLASKSRTEEDDKNIYKQVAQNKKFVNDINKKKQEIIDKGLEDIGLPQLAISAMLDQKKHEVNDLESMRIINYFSNKQGLEPMYKEINTKPLKVVKHSSTKDYNESIKTKPKKEKPSDIKPIDNKKSNNGQS